MAKSKINLSILLSEKGSDKNDIYQQQQKIRSRCDTELAELGPRGSVHNDEPTFNSKNRKGKTNSETTNKSNRRGREGKSERDRDRDSNIYRQHINTSCQHNRCKTPNGGYWCRSNVVKLLKRMECV